MAGRSKQLSRRRRQKPTRDSIPNRKSSIALAHEYAAIIACTVFLSDVLWSLQIHGAWLRFTVVARLVSRLLSHVRIAYSTVLSDSCACGRVYWSSSSRPSSWYSASPPRDFDQGLSDLPVAGIRLLGLLRLGLVLFCFLFSCIDMRLRLLWFRPALSRSL